MPTILIAAIMMAQAPAAVQPAAPTQSSETAAKKKKQICQNIEVTGSRRPQRVCRDENGILRLGPDVSNEAPNSGMFHAPPPAEAMGKTLGGPPK